MTEKKHKPPRAIERPIVLVGAKGFWENRRLAGGKLPESFRQFFSNDLQAEKKLAHDVVAIVAADQPISAGIMDSYPNLRTIARTGTGYDNIDVSAAHARNIAVSRVAELNAEPVSEFAVGLMIALIRNFIGVHEKMCGGKWDRYKGMLISEMTVGIAGLGAIGRSLARKLHSLGVKRLIGWNRTLRPQVGNTVLNPHLELCILEKLMKESDIVVVALALVPETKHLIDKRMLSKMKSTAYLVNVSRGAVVDEDALAEHMSAGKIAGVALDVFSLEPPAGDLFSEPFMQKLVSCAKHGGNVILSPHNAFRTKNSEEMISLRVAENVAKVISGNTEDIELV